jgi:hypothetical protein
VNVRYFRIVAGARPADSRLVRNTSQASTIATRGLLGAGSGATGSIFALPLQEPAFSKASATFRASSQSDVLVVLRENRPSSVPETWI